MARDPLILQAPAKINYHLHVLGRRPDGYHDLDSLMGFLDVGDEIEIKSSASFIYTVSGDFKHHLPQDKTQDLVIRAVRLFEQVAQINVNISLHLTKNIPSSAGLGGGSSDAATILLGLNDWFKTGFSEDELCKIGLVLGSEVPVCIRRRLTHVSGRGEILEEATSIDVLPMLMVWPNIFCTTEKIFKEHCSVLSHEGNDLTTVVTMLYPEVKRCLKELRVQKGCVRAQMNGSGSSCFAVFEKEEHAENARLNLVMSFPDWWVRLVHALPSIVFSEQE